MNQAAKELYVSQPSLSASIAKLEEELGVRLFERNGRHMRLNADGALFLEHAQKILSECDLALAHMGQIARNRDEYVRVGCISTLFRSYFPRMMASFLRQPGCAQVKFQFATARSSDLVEALKLDMYDLALCNEMSDEAIEQIPILRERLIYICPAPRREIADWAEIARSKLIGYSDGSRMDQLICRVARRHRAELSYDYRVPTEGAIASLVTHGFGCAIVPDTPEIDTYPVTKLPLPGEAVYRETYLTLRRLRSSVGASKRFIDFLIAQAAPN